MRFLQISAMVFLHHGCCVAGVVVASSRQPDKGALRHVPLRRGRTIAVPHEVAANVHLGDHCETSQSCRLLSELAARRGIPGVDGARFSMAERACSPENSVGTPRIVPSSVRRGVPNTNPSRLSSHSSSASVVDVGSALIAQASPVASGMAVIFESSPGAAQIPSLFTSLTHVVRLYHNGLALPSHLSRLWFRAPPSLLFAAPVSYCQVIAILESDSVYFTALPT
jgi:hypothetical protein